VREQVRFASGRDECAAWLYRGTNGACVVMAGGFGVPKEPGTDRFAAAFHRAGFTVLAFDYRRLGESGGRPRLVQRVRAQLADWRAAVAFAAALPGVQPGRVAVWGFSLSGGHVLRVGALDGVGAVIAQTPNADGQAATRNALRHQSIGALLHTFGVALLDAVGGLVGRRPLLIPLDGPRGSVAVLTTPDAVGGGAVLDPDNRYPQWQQKIAARSILGMGTYRPGRAASKVRCPLLVVVADDDRSALAEPSVRAAERAPKADLVRVPGGHYAPFLDQHDAVVGAELEFLDRVLAGGR
jgi:fermentation-respiration switch protein FrsA (DUF1100 family)